MHKIFYLHELVDLIVEHLALVKPRSDSNWHRDPDTHAYDPLLLAARRDVKALGQTSIIGLLLAVDAVEEIPRNYGSRGSIKQWRMTRHLSEIDIPLLLRYSSRIRELFLPSLPKLEVIETTEGMLSFQNVVVLFPRLRLISSHSFNNAELNFVMSTVSDGSLTHMVTRTAAPVPPTFMAMVAKRRHRLQALYLSFSDLDDHIVNIGRTVKILLEEAPVLTELHIWNDISQHVNVFSAAAYLPQLTNLSLSDRSLSFDGPNANFHKLTKLHFCMANMASFMSAMANVTFPNLQSFHVVLYTCDSNSHRPRDLLFSIVRVCHEAPLSSLVLRSTSDRDPSSPPMETLGPNSLDILMHFPLQELRIWMLWSWDLTDDTMERIAHEWPDMQDLRLDPAGTWPRPSNVTAYGLEVLTSSCGNLSVLGLQLNIAPTYCKWSKESDPHAHVEDSTWSEALTVLFVGHSNIDSPADVTQFLSHVFPNLKTCTPEQPVEVGDQVMYKRWSDVYEFFSSRNMARYEARQRDDNRDAK
ncbi:hypothetical protein EIP91_010969 [Steccherinum ochraceum]|uniref:F-box domain-containing protein n=1 Tax=Steccherinum ochraceum TaxID=92696 RepID=A0A4R0RIW9_9APHY|nr:hypothetical protein EIP91_010969 [Steccherinum ochraceum]